MRLKDLRTEQNLLQKDVAEMLGVDRSTYSKYESGASEPNFEILLKIARIFNVSIDYLLGNTDQREEKPTPEDGDGLSGNMVKIAGRDGSFYERKLSDSQREMLIQMLNDLKPVDDENV